MLPCRVVVSTRGRAAHARAHGTRKGKRHTIVNRGADGGASRPRATAYVRIHVLDFYLK